MAWHDVAAAAAAAAAANDDDDDDESITKTFFCYQKRSYFIIFLKSLFLRVNFLFWKQEKSRTELVLISVQDPVFAQS